VVAGWLLGIATVAVMTVAYENWRARQGRRDVSVTEEGVEPEVAEKA
jgi:hypothetical protein